MDDTDADIASAPLPTAKTLRARKNLFIQFGRFLAINTEDGEDHPQGASLSGSALRIKRGTTDVRQ